VHLSHLFVNALEDEDSVEFLLDPNDIVSGCCRSSRPAVEGGRARGGHPAQDRLAEARRAGRQREWDLLFRKYYDEEMKR